MSCGGVLLVGMGFGVLCFSLLRAVVAKEGSSGTQALWDQRVTHPSPSQASADSTVMGSHCQT